MRARAFAQVDVFGAAPHAGNPVAVLLDAEGLAEEEMQRFARWTNLSETTFVLPPTAPEASYRVRIFTPATELPFAGHPTLGTCHAWHGAAGEDAGPGPYTQECGAGLVQIRMTPEGLAFAAPPLLRTGAVAVDLLAEIARALELAPAEIIDAQWVDNGPGWVAVLLAEPARVLALRPGFADLDLGVAALYPPGAEAALEVRAFFPKDGALAEDPVTGSLNASLAEWLLRTGRLEAPYVARQGAALGRAGRVHVDRDPDGTIWIAGATRTLLAGDARL